MGRADDPATVARRFNDHINARNLGGLASLMTQDHTFIDSAGVAISGNRACVDAWQGFFMSFPDYRNVFDTVEAHGDVVTMIGHSECSEPSLAGPALWTAKIEHGLVAQWRVYEDTAETRAALIGEPGVNSSRRPR